MKIILLAVVEKIHWQEVVVGLLMLLVSCGYFWPYLKLPATTLPDPVDSKLISWILYRVDDNVLHGRALTDGNVYHPYEDTLTYSDLLLTDALLTLPVHLITKEPIAQYIAALLLAQGLTLMFTYFLLHEVTSDRGIALGGALVFGFSAIRLHYLGHLQMMSLQWVILAMLCLVKVSKKPSLSWLWLGWVALVLQIINSFLPGMFIVLGMLTAMIMNKRLRQNLGKLKAWAGLQLLLAGVIVGPLVFKYQDTFRAFDYVRPINDAMHFSLSVDELWGKFWSPGLWLMGFAGWWVKGKADKSAKWRWWFVLIGFAGLVMAMGPALKWLGQSVKIPLHFGGQAMHIPLPYTLAYYLIPGFKAFRTPSRWLWLAGLSLTVWSGMKTAALARNIRYTVIALVVIVTWIALPPLPQANFVAKADYPAVYYWLKEQPGEVVLELPIASWGQGEATQKETERMLYSTLHGKRLVNGYSGFTPPEWEKMVGELQRTPIDKQIELVKKLGYVDHLLIDNLALMSDDRQVSEVLYEDDEFTVIGL